MAMICSSLCRVPFMPVLLAWVWENSHSRRSSFRGLRQKYRLRIPARYIVDSEGVTPGREVHADYTISPAPSDTLRRVKEIVEASPVPGLQRRSLSKTPLQV